MLYFITHLNIAMVVIGVIGLYGSAYEPGPVPRLMVVISGLYLLAFLGIRAIYVVWHRHRRVTHKQAPQIFNLKEDKEWTA